MLALQRVHLILQEPLRSSIDQLLQQTFLGTEAIANQSLAVAGLMPISATGGNSPLPQLYFL
jgi:hypothetical protein